VIECGEALHLKNYKTPLMQKKWFVLYTRSRCEKKISALLTKRDIENYCPLCKSVRQWSDRKKIIYEPLFPSYVFVHVDDVELLSLKRISGDIVNPVYWLGKPAWICQEEIDAVKYFLKEHGSVRLEKQHVNVNDRVRIIRGPFNNFEANVEAIRNNMVKLSLPALGYMVIAEIDPSDIQVIPGNEKIVQQSYSSAYAN
jgi:transcription antitermination factor NusG